MLNKGGKLALSIILIIVLVASTLLLINIKTASSENWQDWLTLEYNTEHCLAKCEAIFIIKNPTSQDIILGSNDVTIWHETFNGDGLTKPIEVYREEEITEYIDVPEYETCYNQINKNEINMSCEEMNCLDKGTYCDCPYTCQTGSHQEQRTKIEYQPFSFSGKTLHAGELWRIKLVGHKEISEEKNNVEWFINFKGMQPPWAWWNSSVNYKRKIWVNASNINPVENITYYVNGTEGFNLGAGKQIILARTPVLNNSNVSMWLYYNSGSEYYIVNEAETQQTASAITYGNGSNYSSSQVFDDNYLLYLAFNEQGINSYNWVTDEGTIATNSPTRSEDGVIGDCLNFLASSNQKVTGDLGGVNDEITVGVWVKTNGGHLAGNYGGIIADGYTGGNSRDKWELRAAQQFNSSYIFYWNEDDCPDDTTGYARFDYTLAEDGNWHFIVGRFRTSDNNISIYLDGIPQNSVYCSYDTITSSGNYQIGSMYAGGFYYFNGSIDEPFVYHGALSDDEIKAMYDLQKYDYSSLGPEEIGDTIPPETITPIITPMQPTSAENLKCNATLTDEEQTTLAAYWKWYKNNELFSSGSIQVQNGTNSLITTLSATNTQKDEQWICQVEPFDGAYYGDAKNSSAVTILNSLPTHSQPKLQATSVYNGTSDNLTCYNQSTYDSDNDFVTNIYSWQKNSQALEILNLPFESSARDYSFDNNSGIRYGATFTSGKVGKALKFDGIDDYVDYDGVSSKITSVYSIEAWIYPDSVPTTGEGLASAMNLKYGMTYYIDGKVWAYVDGGSHSVQISVPIGQWTHIVTTFDGTYLKLYKNGIEVASANYAGISPIGGTNFRIARYSDYFNGSIDEVRVYNKALTPEQIASHYALEYNKIVANETSAGEIYQCSVTPNDATEDGPTNSSNILQILYKITFDVRSGEDNTSLNNFNIYCNNSWQVPGVNSPYTTGFAPGSYECLFEREFYFNETITFSVDSDKIVSVKMSASGLLTIEEHDMLEWLYNCWKDGDCWDLLANINATTARIWQRLTGTDRSVIIEEKVLSYDLSSTSNISINYTIKVPYKEGVPSGELLPIRLYFWFTNVDRTKCYNQDKGDINNRAESPYCLPLVAEILGPNNGTVNFVVDLRPALPLGTYNFTRSVEIDPVGVWINYGTEDLGTINVLESGDASVGLSGLSKIYPSGFSITGAVVGTIKDIFTKENLIILLIAINIIAITYLIISQKKRQSKFYLIFLFVLFFLFCFSNVGATQTYLEENSTWQGNLSQVAFADLVFGDLNRDNKTDLVLTGCSYVSASCGSYTAKVYINNGTTLEENSTWQGNLTSVNVGGLALGDIDNDGNLDLALTGCNSGGGASVSCNSYIAKIYINNGTTLNENSTWQQNLTGVSWSSLNFGDVDNDGDLDLVLNGGGDTAKISKIYINNGTSLEESLIWESNLSKVYKGCIAFVDINNDNSLDLALSGLDGGYHAEIYINNGTSLEENSTWGNNLLAVDKSSHSFGDFDNDGDLDITLIGHFTIDRHRIYRNNGSTFIELHNEVDDLSGIFDGSLVFGDYDNDGDLDLISTGYEAYTTLYLYNATATNFTTRSQDPESHILNLEYGSTVIWADLDNDYDLDLVLTGASLALGRQAKVYISNRSETQPNNLPQPPNSSFMGNYSSGSVAFGWGNGSDNETPTAGLYYNLRVGTDANKNAVVTGIYGGSSNPTAGYFGNMMQRKNITITRNWDANTTYYWSVQTIDTALATSNWSEEQNFTTPMDTGLPNITLIAPSDGYYSDNMTVMFNATVVDASGIKNVSIWTDFNGIWQINETNSSGKNDTSYVFMRNLTQGTYQWKYQAYDNSTAFNYANSSTRTLHVDLDWPLVTLISPANGSSWTTSSTVTFSFNVSDFAINNCSLIINNAIDQTDDSITINTTQTFSKTLSNGNYNWSVNCTDQVNRRNNSGTFGLTISYNPGGNGGNGGDGGGGGGVAVEANVSNITEIEEPEEKEEPEEEKEKEIIEKIIEKLRGMPWMSWIIIGIISLILIYVGYGIIKHYKHKNKFKPRKKRWRQ